MWRMNHIICSLILIGETGKVTTITQNTLIHLGMCIISYFKPSISGSPKIYPRDHKRKFRSTHLANTSLLPL